MCESKYILRCSLRIQKLSDGQSIRQTIYQTVTKHLDKTWMRLNLFKQTELNKDEDLMTCT